MNVLGQMFDSYPMQLLIAANMFAQIFPKRSKYPLRLLFHALPMLIIYNIGIHRMPEIENYLLDKMFLLIPTVYMVLGIYFCYQCSSLDAVYCTANAHPTQNIVFNLYWILKLRLNFEEGTLGSVMVSLPLMAVVYTIVYYCFARRLRDLPDYISARRRLVGNAFVVMVFVVLFNMRVPESSMEQLVYVAYILADILALFMQYGLFAESDLECRNAITEVLLYKEQQKQQLIAENAELINRKCHDLKHQIAGLRRMESASERDAYIDEIEKAVMIYESAIKTGNETLDLILMERLLYCKEHNIKLTCVADGKLLNRFRTMDIYALFCNALDNAIESVSSEENEENRIISLRVGSRGNFLVIRFENYLGHPLQLKDGLPVTTKKDNQYHGFGILSIRHIVKQYHGTMSVRTENQSFCLDIMIPTV